VDLAKPKKKTTKNKVGRPKKALDLWKGWAKDILDLYVDGASDVEIKALIWTKKGAFSNQLWNRWMEEEEEFSQTIKMGRTFAKAWWEKKGRSGVDSQEINSTMWYMNMKNRYGWRDKQDITSDDKPIQTMVSFGER
tara:strand:- start:4041 stop:4451 length:411 start_codon:yes stop_codon:yes gene_type:complete